MHFSLENDIAASTRMDTSIAKPPVSFVHKRKALEASNNSLNASLGLGAAALHGPAPARRGNLARP